MAKTRGELARETSATAALAQAAPTSASASRLPGPLRFLLLVAIAYSVNLIGATLVAEVTDHELGAISRRLDDWKYVGAVHAWKLLELGICWVGGYDDVDLTALTILTHAPYLYLIHTFYGISLPTAVANLVIDITAIALPIRLLRSRSLTHVPNAPAAAVPNRNIIHDTAIVALNSILGASVYAVGIYLALKLWLPVWLISHFEGVRSVAAAYAESDVATIVNLLVIFFPLGWAVREFVFSPSLGHEAEPHLGDAVASAFNPETSSFEDTVKHNLGIEDKHRNVLVRRAATLVGLVLASTTAQVFARLEGADLVGAAGFAGPWIGAAVVVTGVFVWEEAV